ncbi:MAG: hypothetical protein WCG80_12875 [Spirochaetales bacterium]
MSTDPRLWLLASSFFLGLGLAWATRYKPDSRRNRAWLVPLGLNLAAAGLLGAVLFAGNSADNLAHSPLSWGLEFGVGAVVSFLLFRFPRAAGLPLVVAGAALGWQLSQELAGYAPLDGLTSVARARLMTETAQSWTVELRVEQGAGRVQETLEERRAGDWPVPRVERLDVPLWFPTPLRHWFRVNPPTAVRIPLALIPVAWQRTVAVPPVVEPKPFAVYRLLLEPGAPAWKEEPALLSP